MSKPTFYAVYANSCSVKKSSTQQGRIQKLVDQSNGELEFLTAEQLRDRGSEVVTVINCVTRKEVQIDRRCVGTINDPSLEAYHSF